MGVVTAAVALLIYRVRLEAHLGLQKGALEASSDVLGAGSQ
jgi:hypothetical protein